MLSIVAEQDEPVLHQDSGSGYDPVAGLRVRGNALMVVSSGLVVVVLLFAERGLLWPLLATCFMAILVGVGLRLEAAILERGRS